MNLSNGNIDWSAAVSVAGNGDKAKLFSKLREENQFLREVHGRKSDQVTQLKERKLELIQLIRNTDADIKTKTLALAKLKEAIEQAQRINV